MRYFFVDRILEMNLGKSAKAIKNVTASEDVFRDHFPALPIYPAALLIETMAQVAGLLLEKTMQEKMERRVFPIVSIVKKAKFKDAVVPGDSLIVSVDSGEHHRGRGRRARVHRGGRQAEGKRRALLRAARCEDLFRRGSQRGRGQVAGHHLASQRLARRNEDGGVILWSAWLSAASDSFTPSASDRRFQTSLRESAGAPTEHALGGEYRMAHYDMPSLSQHPFHPDRKQLRYMRPDSVYALIAGGLALQDAGLLDEDHTDTSIFTGAGPCYSDMWPALQLGIIASMDGVRFDLRRFGEAGMAKINPFFSIRSLAALPMAALSEKFGIRGEERRLGIFRRRVPRKPQQHEVFWTFKRGAHRSVWPGGSIFSAIRDKIDSIYFNDFYDEDLVAASGACFLVLESGTHNERRGGKQVAEISAVRSASRAITAGLQVKHRETPLYAGLFEPDEIARVAQVWVQPSGTEKNLAEETAAGKAPIPQRGGDRERKDVRNPARRGGTLRHGRGRASA